MIRIAIVDDEPQERAGMEALVRAFFEERGRETALLSFESGEALLRAYPEALDLILLDISMPGPDGLQTAARIREHDCDALLIFVTSLIQYAVQGYKVDAMDYIVKPVTRATLGQSLARALRRLDERAPQRMTLRSLDGLRSLDVNEIVYVEAVNHRATVHTREEAVECAQALSRLETALEPHGFFRCHAAFLVNMKRVERIDGNDLYAAGQRIPISKHRRKEFMRALALRWGENG